MSSLDEHGITVRELDTFSDELIGKFDRYNRGTTTKAFLVLLLHCVCAMSLDFLTECFLRVHPLVVDDTSDGNDIMREIRRVIVKHGKCPEMRKWTVAYGTDVDKFVLKFLYPEMTRRFVLQVKYELDDVRDMTNERQVTNCVRRVATAFRRTEPVCFLYEENVDGGIFSEAFRCVFVPFVVETVRRGNIAERRPLEQYAEAFRYREPVPDHKTQ